DERPIGPIRRHEIPRCVFVCRGSESQETRDRVPVVEPAVPRLIGWGTWPIVGRRRSEIDEDRVQERLVRICRPIVVLEYLARRDAVSMVEHVVSDFLHDELRAASPGAAGREAGWIVRTGTVPVWLDEYARRYEGRDACVCRHERLGGGSDAVAVAIIAPS